MYRLMIKIRLVFVMLSWSIVGCIMAQDILCRHYGMADGLFNMQTRKVIEMPDGRILVQLEGMFDIFDGERFRNLEYDRNKIININSFLNTDYYFDNNRLLWVKDNSHLFAINIDTYEFVDAKKQFANAKLSADISNFFLDHTGSAIVETEDKCVYVYDWQGPARKILKLTERNVEDKIVQLADAQKVGNKYALFLSNGKLTFVNENGNGATRTEQIISGAKEHLLKAMRWNDETLLIRDADGLVSCDMKTLKKTRLLTNGNVFDFKKSSLLDSEKLCVSTNHKIFVFNSMLELEDSISTLIDEKTGEANTDNMQGAVIDRQNGIWIATFNNGLYYKPNVKTLLHFNFLGEENDVILHLFFKNNPNVRGKAMQVTDRLVDRDNQTWLTLRNDGIVMIDSTGRNVDWLHYGDVPGLWGAVSFIRQIDNNRYLICYRLNRLAILHKKERTLLSLTDKDPELMQFRNMVEITNVEGGFMIGTQNGFFALERKGLKPNFDRFKVLNENPHSDKCNCLLPDDDNIIWIGTQNGLFRLDEARQQLTRYSTKDGLPNNCIQSMVKDGEGNLWIATMGGVSKMNRNPGDIQFLSIPDNKGTGLYKFSERMAFCIGDSLFFGTDNGVLSLSPEDVNLPSAELVPRLMSFMANDSTVVFCHENNRVDIFLKYNENYVNMDISSLNYAYPQNTLYRYRIDELGGEWIIPEVHNGKLSISFSALEPGKYTIRVQSAMQGQEWGHELKVVIRVLPPWWRTWWAYTSYLILFLALVASFAYLYVKSQKDKLAIEQKEASIRQLLEQIKLKSQIPEDIEVENNAEITVSKEDELFLQKAMECIERNMENADYGVEAFSGDMAMERTTLYRHLQASIGKPPKEFIRTVRLKKAAELLRTGKYNVGEVADLVGFGNRKSFAKFFKESFGVLPSKYN